MAKIQLFYDLLIILFVQVWQAGLKSFTAQMALGPELAHTWPSR